MYQMWRWGSDVYLGTLYEQCVLASPLGAAIASQVDIFNLVPH
jgi:hypothetical protein